MGTDGHRRWGRPRRLGDVEAADTSIGAKPEPSGTPTVPHATPDRGPVTPDHDVIETPAALDEGLDRIFTAPNLITMVRLACVPLYVWLLFGAHLQTLAAVLLGVLGATDWVDGYVARRFHQVSTFGKVLDPVADRVLVATAVITITVHGAVPVWFGAATLLREVVVSVAVIVLASLGAARIDVLWVGKAGTFALMCAYPLFLLGDGPAEWQRAVRLGAWGCGLVGLALAWVAAASYVPVAHAALTAGRRAEPPVASETMRG